MIRKFLSLLIIIALMSTPVFATGFSDIDEEDSYFELVSVLEALGVLSSKSDSAFRADNTMSKGEFTEIVVKNLLQLAIGDQEVKQIFTDVSENHRYAASIYAAFRMGIIVGASETLYGVERPIKVGEAVKIMINALGYNTYAESKGGFPTGYMVQANNLRLLNGISNNADSELKRYEIAHLLYNSLETDVMRLVTIGDTVSYGVTSKQNVLTEYLKCNVTTGIVNRVYNTSLTNPDLELSKNEVYIGNGSYKVGATNAESLLGYKVKAYYSETDDSDEKELLYIYKRGNNEIKIQSQFIDRYEDFTLTYTIDEFDDVDRKLKLSNTTDFILNGKAWIGAPSSGFLTQYGNITAIDNNQDGKYDVVIVNSYEDYIVSSINVKDTVIFSKTADSFGSRRLVLSDIQEENLKIFDAEGQAVLFSSIQEDDVLSVRMSADNTLAEILISSEKLSGTITEINDEEVEIDYLSKTIVPSFRNEFDQLSAGFSGTFYIDVFGGVAGIESTDDSNVKYGYLAAIEEPKGLDSKVKLKIFTKEGTMLTVDAADRLTINQDLNKRPEDLLTIFVKTSAAGRYTDMQVIKYRLGKDGTLKEIAEVENEVAVASDVSWRADSRSFGSVVLSSSDTAWFVVPKAEAGKETELNGAPDTSFSSTANLSNNVKYNDIYAYDIDEGGVAAVIIRKTPYSSIYPVGGLSGNAPAVSDTYVMVDKITQTIDSEGNKVPKLYFMERGALMSYPAKDENILKKYQYIVKDGQYAYKTKDMEDETVLFPDDGNSYPPDSPTKDPQILPAIPLQRGDIIQYRINDAQEIVGIKVVWDISRETSGYEKTVTSTDGRKEYPYKHMMRSGEERGYVYGTVVSQKNGFIGVSSRGTNSQENVFGIYYYNAKAAPVMVYDVAKGEVYKGAFGDIEDENSAGVGSKVFIHNRWYSTYEIFIYKNLTEKP